MTKKARTSVSLKTRQVHKYDKIWRENLDSALPGILEKVLKIRVVESEDLPHKIQLTQQKEADVFRKVTDVTGATFVLHIEIQTADEPRMVYRMLEYRILAEQVYDLPVRQFVLYMGERVSGMKTEMVARDLFFRYTLISFRELPYQLFLSSDKPEEKLLSVLADFGDENPESVLRNVIEEVVEASEGQFARNRHLQQLRIIIQLRSLAIVFNKAMKTVASFFKEEKDPLFIIGEKRGVEKGREESIQTLARSLIRETDFDDAKIARILDVEAELVAGIRRQTSSNQK